MMSVNHSAKSIDFNWHGFQSIKVSSSRSLLITTRDARGRYAIFMGRYGNF